MNGPAAPKDPEKRRDSFYIIKNKEIFGSKMEDGRGIQFLYQDSGRMINSAQIVGGITDEEILALMETVEGFKKLVHSIGISVETADKNEEVTFIFQMYGTKDLYGGGTNLVCKLKGNGSEERIYLSDIEWREDDNVPGQIKVIMETPEQLAQISVRFYLNDGFHAPEVAPESEIDFASEEYSKMIANSLVATGDYTRLARAIAKAKQNEKVTLAYIGGSITQGAGAIPINTECYAYKSYRLFAEAFGCGENVEFVKAGVGGTPSELGMLRFDRDVLRDGTKKPDVVVIEFAVNDEGDETKGDCYESLVRKVLNLPNHPAVILLFSVFANDDNLQKRMIPIGEHYNLPMVSIKNAVTEQFYCKAGEGRVLSKNQFFYDMYHPTNVGHTIMAESLQYLCKCVEKAMEQGNPISGASREDLVTKPALVGNTYEFVRLMDKKDTYAKAEIVEGGFTGCDEVLQSVEMDVDLKVTPEFPYNWYYDGTQPQKAFFDMTIDCKALLLIFKDSGEADAAKANIFVDGKFVRVADPYVNGWLHCNAMVILDEKESRTHQVRIEVCEEDQAKKCTLLGFGYVE